MANAVSVVSAIEWAREKMQQIIDAVNRLFFLVRWIRGHGEIALLYAEDLATLFRGGIGLDQRAVEGLTTCLCRIVTHGLDMCHITYVVFTVI